MVWTEASSDEEVWKATLVWAEAKAQEREAIALKAASETDTDESYDSDDSEVGVSIQPVRKSALFGDNDEFDKKRVSFGVISVVEVKKFMKEDYVDDWSKDGKHLVWEGRSAATIIQAVTRGRAVRAWNAFASADKNPSKAGQFTAFDPRSYDIYDQNAWYRAAFTHNGMLLPSAASQTDKCPYPDSDEDEGDGDYGTDDDDFSDFPPLPEGWMATKAHDGRVYYFHAATKKMSWTRPMAVPAPGHRQRLFL